MKTFKTLREEAIKPVKVMVVFSDGALKSYPVPKDTSFKDYVKHKIAPYEKEHFGREVVHYGVDGKMPDNKVTITDKIGVKEEVEDDQFAKWKSDIKASHPEVAARLKFISKPDAPHISAEVPGQDRSYGLWNHKEGRAEDLVGEKYQGQPSTTEYEYKHTNGSRALLSHDVHGDGSEEYFTHIPSTGQTTRHSTKDKAHASLRVRGYEPTGEVEKD